ncbi:hypothetical protein, partial [Candidatus Phytoplasma oryzae]
AILQAETEKITHIQEQMKQNQKKNEHLQAILQAETEKITHIQEQMKQNQKNFKTLKEKEILNKLNINSTCMSSSLSKNLNIKSQKFIIKTNNYIKNYL